MKKIFTLLLLFSASTISFAQSHLQWTTPEITTGSQVNLFEGTTTDISGNTYTINFTQDPNNHYFTYRFFYYNIDGVKEWQYDNDSCFTDCYDKYNIIVPVDNEGALFVGSYSDMVTPWQIRIKRIGGLGSLIWQNYWTGPYAYASPVAARLDHAGNLVVAMKAIVSMPLQEDFAIAKFNMTNGHLIWHFEIPDGGTGTASLSEIINAMVIDSANNIYCSGRAGFDNVYFKVDAAGSLDYKLVVHDNDSIAFLSSGGVVNLGLNNNPDLFLLISQGTQTWVQKYNAQTGAYLFTKKIQHDSAATVAVDFFIDNNEVYALSNYNYFIPDTTFAGGHYTNVDYMITKFNANGNTVWEKSYLENVDSLAQQNGSGGAAQMGFCNGHLYALSSAVVDSAGDYSYSFLTKIDTAGNVAWYDTTREQFGPGVFAIDTGCSVYISRSMRLGNYVAVVTQKFGELSTAGVEEMNEKDPYLSIYPNPANTEINLKIPVMNNFELELINTFGETLLKEKNKISIDVSSLPQGIYFLRIKQGSNYYSRKFVMQK